MAAGRLSNLTRDRILFHNVLVSSGTVVAGVLGFGFQAVISHQLEPSQYGSVFAVVTLITLIGLPAGAFSLIMARQASQDRAYLRTTASASLLRDGDRYLLVLGSVLATALITTSPWLSSFLNIPIGLLVAAAVGIPFTLSLPLLLGELQGEQRFAAFSLMAAGQAGLKLIAAVVLGAVLGPVGVILGVSLAGAMSYVIVRGLLRREFRVEGGGPWRRAALSYLMIVLPSTLALAVLLSADILLAKHFFSPRIAGQYGAVAALGRAIFWGSTGVAAVLFPKLVFNEARSARGVTLVLFSLGLVSTGAAIGLVLLTIYSTPILTLFAGPAYAGGAAYLQWYALGMALLGAVSVLVSAHQSRGNPGFLWALLPASLIEPALIVQFHRDPMQVVILINICAGLLLVTLLAAYAYGEYRPRVSGASRETRGRIARIGPDFAPLSAADVGTKPQ